MAEEIKTGDVAAGQTTGATADAAGQQQTGAQAVAAAQDGMTEREKGLLAAKEAETRKRQELEGQVASLNQQFQVLQAQQQPIQQPVQQPTDFFGQQGLGDDDFVNVKHIRQFANSIVQQNQMTAQQSAIVNFVNQHTDFASLVGTVVVNPYTRQPVFVPSETMKQVIAENPHLANLGDPVAAYEIAKRHQKLTELNKQLDSHKEQQINQQVAVKTNPMPSSAVGGGATVANTQFAGLDMTNPKDRLQILKVGEEMLSGKFG